MFGGFGGFDFDAIERARQARRDEFEKLACEPCMKSANEGDRVLVAAGPVGRGFEWMRHEAIVLEVADTAYRVRYTDYKSIVNDGPVEEWVHRFVVTDVLGPPKTEAVE